MNKNGKATNERLFYSIRYLEHTWKPRKQYDVVFFNKGGMWLCCGPSNAFSKNIGFNTYIKAIATKLIRLRFDGPFNAVHVRRGGGHTSSDRRTATGFYKAHLTLFNNSLPLFIATDEKDKTWFNPLKNRHGFKTLFFWKDLDAQVIDMMYSNFPSTMHGDISGFIEQIICAKAHQWAGSHASTFSAAIGVFRSYKNLRQVKPGSTPFQS